MLNTIIFIINHLCFKKNEKNFYYVFSIAIGYFLMNFNLIYKTNINCIPKK